MQFGDIRFDTELKFLRGFIELRKHGVRFADLEDELLKLGPVDLDLVAAVLDKLSSQVAEKLPPDVPSNAPVVQPSQASGSLLRIFGRF